MNTHPVLRLRVYRLVPWMVRALIPEGLVGTYVLYDDGRLPTYAGRSDTDLQVRLVQHARAGRGEFFEYAVHVSLIAAYTAECGLFHALKPDLQNVIHPALPAGMALLGVDCPFCRETFLRTTDSRFGGDETIGALAPRM